MTPLKPISIECVPAALQKAERYRLIKDPWSAESICQDVLTVDPENQHALVTLLLAITDQFPEGPTEGVRRAREVLPRLKDEYKRAYYAGLICERCAEAQLQPDTFRSGDLPYYWLQEAMSWYEKAEAQRPAGNDEALLRWNACVRLLASHPHLKPREEESVELSLE
jgi:hypothetical protein